MTRIDDVSRERKKKKKTEITVTKHFLDLLQYSWASLVAQLVKNMPAMWETWVQFLGWEDPLEKGRATHPSILTWRISWTV